MFKRTTKVKKTREPEGIIGYRVRVIHSSGSIGTIGDGISYQKAIALMLRSLLSIRKRPKGVSAIEVLHNPTGTKVAMVKNCFDLANISPID